MSESAQLSDKPSSDNPEREERAKFDGGNYTNGLIHRPIRNTKLTELTHDSVVKFRTKKANTSHSLVLEQ